MSELGIKHHLSEQILLAYATGSLPEAFSLVVACHLSLCEQCRSTSDALDVLGGAVLEDTAKAQMSADALSATLALIDAQPALPVEQAPTKDASFPSPLVEYVGGGLDHVKWKRVGAGVKQAILHQSKDATARLLHIPAGTAIPEHGHNGMELTLVLEGSFSDETDTFGRGDVESANSELEHTPIADPGADCICLAATDAPLKFNSLIPRILQPFIGI